MDDLPFRDQVFDRAGNIFDRHLGVDPMLVEEVDVVGIEPLEHPFGCDLDMPGAAVQTRATLSCLRVDIPAELRGDDDLAADRGQSLADEFFIGERPVGLRCIEERHAMIGGGADERDAVLAIRCRTVSVAQTHATKAD